jgi:hypothetical protein
LPTGGIGKGLENFLLLRLRLRLRLLLLRFIIILPLFQAFRGFQGFRTGRRRGFSMRHIHIRGSSS